MTEICHVISRSGNYTALLEEVDGRYWCHLKVKKYSRNGRAEILNDIPLYHAVAKGAPLWCMREKTHPEVEKWKKFITIMGFKPAGEEEDGRGILCYAYKREM